MKRQPLPPFLTNIARVIGIIVLTVIGIVILGKALMALGTHGGGGCNWDGCGPR